MKKLFKRAFMLFLSLVGLIILPPLEPSSLVFALEVLSSIAILVNAILLAKIIADILND